AGGGESRRAVRPVDPGRREGAPRRLRLRQRRLACRAAGVRRPRARGAAVMTSGKLLLAGAVAVVAVGTPAVLGEPPAVRPAFVDRLEYPLDYGHIVRTHAERNRLD